MAAMPDPQERYEYYMCINKFMHPLTQKADIFYDDAKQSAQVVGSNLIQPDNTNEFFNSRDTVRTTHEVQI